MILYLLRCYEALMFESLCRFIASYVIVGGTILINVVLTVLLDEFISSVSLEKQREAQLQEEEAAANRVGSVLDPLTV